jgi:hypothetical protein
MGSDLGCMIDSDLGHAMDLDSGCMMDLASGHVMDLDSGHAIAHSGQPLSFFLGGLKVYFGTACYDDGLCQHDGKISGLVLHWHQFSLSSLYLCSSQRSFDYRYSNKSWCIISQACVQQHQFPFMIKAPMLVQGPVIGRGTHCALSSLDRAHMGSYILML